MGRTRIRATSSSAAASRGVTRGLPAPRGQRKRGDLLVRFGTGARTERIVEDGAGPSGVAAHADGDPAPYTEGQNCRPLLFRKLGPWKIFLESPRNASEHCEPGEPQPHGSRDLIAQAGRRVGDLAGTATHRQLGAGRVGRLVAVVALQPRAGDSRRVD